ncbi:MAG: methyltransferase domain-containing protein [Acidobacteriota bacterium]
MIKRAAVTARYGGTGRWCPLCEKSARRNKPFGQPERAEAKCPYCGALERHRLVWLFLERFTDLFSRPGARVLDFAPLEIFGERFAESPQIQYITADLHFWNVDLRLDIERLPFADRSFDVVYCSHVLEHVDDDRVAMAHLRRILRPDGWAIVMVPIMGETTDEDPEVTDPLERIRRFGQSDHVRAYGLDIATRLRNAGFEVRVFEPGDVARNGDGERMQLHGRDEYLFYCSPV